MRFCLIFLVLMVSLSFAASDCVGYTDSFDVRVLNAKLLPFEGADVSVKFDRGASFGEQYFTTEPRKTDESGKVHFTLLNQGTETREIDCRIWIYVTIGGETGEKVIEANRHNNPVDVQMSVYEVEFTVKDQVGRRLENATVFFLDDTKITDRYGIAVFHGKQQTAEYVVTYKGGQEGGSITIIDDTKREVTIPVYQLNLKTVDDRGDPISATITYADEEYESDGSLMLTVYTSEVELDIEHGGIEKPFELFISDGDIITETIPFDIHSPEISDIKQSLVGDRVRLAMTIEDDGKYAEGVDPSTVNIRYRVLPGNDWDRASAFTIALNRYAVDFPEIEQGRIVEFTINAEDYMGNKVTRDGRFTVQAEVKPEVNDSEDQQENGGEEQEFPYLYIIFGVIFIIIAFYIVKFIIQFKKSGDGGT